MKIKLYAEGGGGSKALKRACRRGFRKFIEKSGLKGTMPEIVASGSRRNAYDDFATRHHHIRLPRMNVRCFWLTRRGRYGNPGRGNTSRTVMAGTSLRARQTTKCHLMVQVMESWFLADTTALAEFYGQGFRKTALRTNPQIEQVPKEYVLSGIRRATDSTTKGRYDKGSHSFEILATIDPAKVTSASPLARRLVETLSELRKS